MADEEQNPLLGMGDLLDQQLESADGRLLGRVADIAGEWRADGSFALTTLLLGPEALIGRVAEHLRPLARRALGGRFERSIPLSEIAVVGTTIRLCGTAASYRERYGVGRSEWWIANHILRFIPGSGFASDDN